MGLNCISLAGRLVRDPELRKTQTDISVAFFTVAVEQDFGGGEKKTDFIDCVAWRSTGEFVAKYFRKGNMIAVTGRLQSRKWVDSYGGNRTSWEVVADHCYFCGGKREEAAEEKPQAEEHGGSDEGLPF